MMIPVSLKALISPTMQDYCVYMHVYVSVYTPNEPIFNHQGKVMCVFFMFGVAISTFNLKSMMFCVKVKSDENALLRSVTWLPSTAE